MVFVIKCGADLHRRKDNLRLCFAVRPSLPELVTTVETQFDTRISRQSPVTYPDIPFRVQTFQVYDDILMRWVDLYHTDQLTNGCQVYAFQPDSRANPDFQGAIPLPVNTVPWVAMASPDRSGSRRGRVEATVTPSGYAKLRSVFAELENPDTGTVLYSDLRRAFLRLDMDVTYATLGILFQLSAEADRDGVIPYEEWVRFAIEKPTLVEALYFRQKDATAGRPYYMTTSDEQPTLESVLVQNVHPTARNWNTEAEYARARAQSKKDLSEARREHDVAKARADLAAVREREARDRLYYTPSPTKPHDPFLYP